MIARMTGNDYRAAWGLFGRRYRLGVTMADDRERITRA